MTQATNRKKHVMTKQDSDNIELRVGKLESAVESLAQDVKGINSAIHEISVGFNTFKEAVIERIGKVSEPRWPLIISIASLVTTMVVMGATLIAFLFSGQSAIIQNNKRDIATLQQQLIDQEFARGQFITWKENVTAELVHIGQTIEDIRQWKITHAQDAGYIQAEIDNLNKKYDQLYQEFIAFGSFTASNRWTKEDHQHYELMIEGRLEELRNCIDNIEACMQ